MNLFIRPLTLLLAAGMALQTAPVPSGTPAAAPATTIFHSDVLHLDYTYPTTFAPMGDMADQAMQQAKDESSGLVKAAISCVSLPLMTMDTTNGLRMILIVRIDGDCVGAPVPVSDLGGASAKALTGTLERFGAPTLNAAASYQVGGHDAAVISETAKSEKYNMMVYGTVTCMVQGKDGFCFELIASDCAQLPGMMSYPMQIDGKAAEPLIPAKFALACKS